MRHVVLGILIPSDGIPSRFLRAWSETVCLQKGTRDVSRGLSMESQDRELNDLHQRHQEELNGRLCALEHAAQAQSLQCIGTKKRQFW